MARNGSGTYSNPYPNFVSGTVISSSETDANNSAIATALTQSIAVDGQSTVTANLPLNAKKLTGLAVGTAATDSLSLGQAQAEAFVWCGTAGGTANAITLAPSPAITAYAAGQRFVWMASGSANTGATTVAISGLGAIALQDNGAALVAGNHAASKMFMGILNTTSTVQIMQVQSSGTDPLIVSSLTVSGTSVLTGVTTHGDDVVSDTDSTDDLGTTSVRWANLFVDGITATDQITATGFTGTLDGILGSGTPAAATVTQLTSGGNIVSDTDSTDDLGTTGVRWANTWTETINGVTSPTAQYTSAEETKLAGIEASADVTDATNVASALANGVAALTSGEVTQLANIGTAAISAAEWGYVAASTQAYDSADHTKLNGIEALADVTDATNVLAGLAGQVAAAATFEPTGDTSAGDNAAMGYTSVLGAILTGQGSTNDVTLVNDADATVLSIPTGTTNVAITGDITANNFAGRNYIINGQGLINQRGAQTGMANGAYFSDRWSYSYAGTAVVNGSTVSEYIEVDVTTADAALGASDQAHIRQKIEADNVTDFLLGTASAKTVTLSFKHKHTKTGTYCVFFLNSAGNRSYVAEYTQSVSNTEETASITVTLDTTGTWVTTGTGNGLLVGFSMGSGSTYHATADTWTAGTYFATSNQVNALDSASNYFRITDVQLELGSTATEFEVRPVGDTLALCQRYYQRHSSLHSCWSYNTTTIRCSVAYSPQLRAAGTLSMIDTTPAISDGVAAFTGSSSAITNGAASVNGQVFKIDGFSGLTAWHGFGENQATDIWAVSAEL